MLLEIQKGLARCFSTEVERNRPLGYPIAKSYVFVSLRLDR